MPSPSEASLTRPVPVRAEAGTVVIDLDGDPARPPRSARSRALRDAARAIDDVADFMRHSVTGSSNARCR